MMKTICVLIYVSFIVQLGFSQKTYYVSNSGNDGNSGDSIGRPWRTLEHAANQNFIPGDSILLEKGSIFRETLSLESSGNKQRQITWGSYGTGARPKILGSVAITSWTNVTGNIWVGDQPISRNPQDVGYGAQVFFIVPNDTIPKWGVFKAYTSNLDNLTKEYDWSWNSEKVYIFSPIDPNTGYTKVECPQREYGIRLNGNSYITIDNLDIRYLASAGVYETYGNVGVNGLHITNCQISNIGFKNSGKAFGLSVTSSNAYYAYNTIHDCGRRAISINVYNTHPAGVMRNIVIEHNHLYRGWHTTGVDCINSGDHLVDSLIIRNNFIAGDPSVLLAGNNPNSNSIFIANQTTGTGITKKVYVYNNIIYCNHGKGIALENIDTAFIVFNTLYGFNPTLSNSQGLISLSTPGNRHVIVKNNIVFNDGTNSYNSGLNSVFVAKPEESVFLLDHNLYFNTDQNQDIFEFYEAGVYDDEYTMAQWSTYLVEKSPNDANSPAPSDPRFINAPLDFHLSPSSPAKNSGTPIPFVLTDYEGKIRDSDHPSIGAYEYFLPDSTDAKIIYFFIPGQTSSNIDTINNTITVLMPDGTDITDLTPSILISYAATVTPESGVSQNFSSPVEYTVVSGDKSNTRTYIVTINTTTKPKPHRDVSLSLAPNPANDKVKLTILGTPPTDTFFVRLFTFPGNIVYISSYFTGTTATIPLENNLQNGTYIIEVVFQNLEFAATKLFISR